MTIEITGPPESPAPDPPDAVHQNGVHTQDQASDATVPTTEAEAAVSTAVTGARRKDRRWVALLSRIFAAAKESRPKRRRHQRRMAYLEHALMAREMERL
jgi:hypothetical protein